MPLGQSLMSYVKGQKAVARKGKNTNRIKDNAQSTMRVSLCPAPRCPGTVIIGFDAEWTEDPRTADGNIILSYQTSLLVEGKEPSNMIHWTRTGAALRGLNEPPGEFPDRHKFADLIARA